MRELPSLRLGQLKQQEVLGNGPLDELQLDCSLLDVHLPNIFVDLLGRNHGV